jgi:hypothetical protein
MRDVRSYRALRSLQRQRARNRYRQQLEVAKRGQALVDIAGAEIDAGYQECNSAEKTARDLNFPIEKRRLAS